MVETVRKKGVSKVDDDALLTFRGRDEEWSRMEGRWGIYEVAVRAEKHVRISGMIKKFRMDGGVQEYTSSVGEGERWVQECVKEIVKENNKECTRSVRGRGRRVERRREGGGTATCTRATTAGKGKTGFVW